MFDDLRPKAFEDESDDESPNYNSQSETIYVPPKSKAAPKRRASASGGAEIPILGMTAAQRLIIAVMLFLNVAVLGCFLLIATGAVVLPGT